METLKVYIRNKPTESYDWNTNTVKFENGMQQYQQTWTKPQVAIAFTTEGLKSYIDDIIDFFNARKGMMEAFYCDPYRTGETKIYRFASAKLEPQWFYDFRGEKVGATMDISLLEEKEQDSNDNTTT